QLFEEMVAHSLDEPAEVAGTHVELALAHQPREEGSVVVADEAQPLPLAAEGAPVLGEREGDHFCVGEERLAADFAAQPLRGVSLIPVIHDGVQCRQEGIEGHLHSTTPPKSLCSSPPAFPFISYQPSLVRIDDERVGLLHAGEERSHLVAEYRDRTVSAVDVEP